MAVNKMLYCLWFVEFTKSTECALKICEAKLSLASFSLVLIVSSLSNDINFVRRDKQGLHINNEQGWSYIFANENGSNRLSNCEEWLKRAVEVFI